VDLASLSDGREEISFEFSRGWKRYVIFKMDMAVQISFEILQTRVQCGEAWAGAVSSV